MSNMDFMSVNFPTIFKSPDKSTAEVLSSGQKVVCTPEVSLYTYPGPEITGASNRVEDKGGGSGGGNSSTSSNGINGFQCGFCGKTFQQKNTFQNHLRSHREGEDPYQCDICSKTFAVPARLTRHYRTHTGEKPYQCEYCNKSFSVKENLSVHRRIHTKERPYKCEVCERAFEHSGKLHRHMRIHTGERPHRCTICQKTFIQSGQLVIHMRTHTGEKPYVCKVCNKGFTCSKQLKVHTRTHTGEKPYTCDICGKSFGYNHVLKLHQVAHYGEKVYKCTLCNGTFNSKKALETHIKTHASDASGSPGDSMDPGVMSPSSISQTPQHSDKENRETSDSEISSQNSPTAEAPKTPPSPHFSNHFKPNIHNNNNNNSSGTGNLSSNGSNYHSGHANGNTGPANLPYPMLPPSIQVHQAPQSRTTFLYVTSKLPPHATNGNSTSNLNNHHSHHPSDSSPRTTINSNGISLKSLSLGLTTPPKSSPIDISSRDRDKLFLHSASIRDKVLAFTEKFGYGIPNSSNGSPMNSNSGNSTGPEHSNQLSGSNSNNTSSNGSSNSSSSSSSSITYNNYNRGRFDMSRNSFEREMLPENICGFPMNPNMKSQFLRNDLNSYSRSRSRDSSRSPDNSRDSFQSGGSYTPGGVLALALTCGSKAVTSASQLPSLTPMGNPNNLRTPHPMQNFMQNNSPPHSNPDSPEMCIDFSRRSVSPRNGMTSPTPSTTPRSTPGLSESAEDLSDDYHHSSPPRYSPEKRGKSSSYGPRKRSSLILEKYAQENSPSVSPPSSASSSPSSSESILSQRLRLSSVIQYAEKCT
ncbi:unnamed protein product [Allacma fusca]|uniref:C2H2-type domain-containing protein n=1 Tax=Allacma fusca TaxID=39272 RepID=A0A8J2KM34_9HEXA|nr:unnamed protein product [Allacma fusca]